MTEETGSAELDVLLAQAKALIERGKQRRALDALWRAEAIARGKPEAIRELTSFASRFEPQFEPRQKAHLEELARTLQHDAEAASRPPQVALPAEVDEADPVRVVLWTFLALCGGGALLGGVLGFVGSSSCSGDMLCFSRGDTTIAGALIFGLAGAGIALVGLLVWLVLRTVRHRRSPH